MKKKNSIFFKNNEITFLFDKCFWINYFQIHHSFGDEIKLLNFLLHVSIYLLLADEYMSDRNELILRRRNDYETYKK